jgi:iron-sulfur cluster repair protein YtfE (RIC family)
MGKAEKCLSKKEERMKATEILKTDHRNVLDLIDQGKVMKERNALLLQRLYDNLKVHTACEEQIFYPAVNGLDHHDEIQRSIEEHQAIDDLLEEVMAIRAQKGIDTLRQEVTTLGEMLQQHIQKEEGVLFPEAEDQLKGRLDDLGNQIERLKIDLRTSEYGMAA